MENASDHLSLTNEPSPAAADLEVVKAGLLAFNVEHIQLEPRAHSLNLFLRDPSGKVVGGLLGGWRWGWLYVDKLWVRADYRKRGAGSQLLKAAEAEAAAAGCTDAVLDTFSFQARDFYERHGYVVYATLEGFPPGHRQYLFHKKLSELTVP